MSTPAQIILEADHLSKIFGEGPTSVRAVNDVSFTVKAGELIVMMGPSGSGKTTLVSMLGALLQPSSGRVIIDGIDLTAMGARDLAALRARKLGFIFQSFNLLEALSVEENILFPAHLAPGGRKAAMPRAEALLQRLNLVSRRKAYPKTLSGGEKQRVAIARALINEPQIIFADEPTGNLDSKTGQDVMMILHDVARDRGCAVVLVTHDPRIEEIADRVLWLVDGALTIRKEEDQEWVRDVVCGMRVDKKTADHVSTHEGREFYFCSSRCLERFDADPEEYLSSR